MRILVVEDSVRLADTLAEALTKEQYTVDIVHDGKSGYEVLSAIRREGQEVPVLILSAKNELEDKLQGFTVGADDYVTKPFEIRELLMRIQAICQRRGVQEIHV